MFGVAGTRGRRRDNNIASNVLVTVVNIVQWLLFGEIGRTMPSVCLFIDISSHPYIDLLKDSRCFTWQIRVLGAGANPLGPIYVLSVQYLCVYLWSDRNVTLYDAKPINKILIHCKKRVQRILMITVSHCVIKIRFLLKFPHWLLKKRYARVVFTNQ